MRLNEISIPDELDERLIEWSRYFKDRHKFNRCKSLEGGFNPYAPGAWDSGWGDPGAPTAILPDIVLPRVLKTHACIQELPKANKWAITFGYCYPGLERWQVLKSLKKYCGRRFTWKEYLEVLDVARLRVWSGIMYKNTPQPIDTAGT